jgi:hypothetical protein
MSIDPINDLVKVIRKSLPADVTTSDIGQAIATTIATVLAQAEGEVTRLSLGIHLGTATGLFLDQHAKDRGLRRQGGETDDQLRERLRTPPAAGTVSAIVDAVSAIVGGLPIYIIELPKDSLYFDREFFFDIPSTYIGGGRGVVIALIPASANAAASVSDALRSKVSAGKLWLVEEYT